MLSLEPAGVNITNNSVFYTLLHISLVSFFFESKKKLNKSIKNYKQLWQNAKNSW